MFRKMMAVSATAALMALSACSSNVTGPVTSTPKAPHPAPKPPQEMDRVCLSDLRAVQIMSPTESDLLYGDDTVMFQWQTREICRRYTAELLISTDDGLNFTSEGEYVNATSALWQVPNRDGMRVFARVVIHDIEGAVLDDLSFNNRVIGHKTSGRTPKVPQQRD